MKLFLLGGFLGSGKTTAISKASMMLKEQMRVALITNDQGAQLVDTAFISHHQIPAREVINGCFCCNYEDLDAGIRSLTEEVQPDVVFAESVGSCTDLVATVVNPLLYDHPSLEIVVSIFADAGILLRHINNEPVIFEKEVEYIYHKQLEEADLLVVNKIDLIDHARLQELRTYISQTYPGKCILYQNSLDEESIMQWIESMQDFQLPGKRKTLTLDYETYAAGEFKLGWLDEELEILSPAGSAMNTTWMLMQKIDDAIRAAGFPIGHLKFLVNDGIQRYKFSYVSLHRKGCNGFTLNHEADKCRLLINARVQAEPARLKQLVAQSVEDVKKETGCRIIERKMLAFRPGFPKPKYRIES
jgi:Ni2+-binding GTPase involved in maturation of urease and hydrogenase